MKTLAPAQSEETTFDEPSESVAADLGSNADRATSVPPSSPPPGGGIPGDPTGDARQILEDYRRVRSELLFDGLGADAARVLQIARGGDLVAASLDQDLAALAGMDPDEAGALIGQIGEETEELEAAWLLLDAYDSVADLVYRIQVLRMTPALVALLASQLRLSPAVGHYVELTQRAAVARKEISEGLLEAGEAVVQLVVQEGAGVLLALGGGVLAIATGPELAGVAVTFAAVELGNAVDDALGSDASSAPADVISAANRMVGRESKLDSVLLCMDWWKEVSPKAVLDSAGRVIGVLDAQAELTASMARARAGLVELLEVGPQIEGAEAEIEAVKAELRPLVDAVQGGVVARVEQTARELADALVRVREAESTAGHWF